MITVPLTHDDVQAVRALCRMAAAAGRSEQDMLRCDYHRFMEQMRAAAGRLAAWCDEKEAELAVAERAAATDHENTPSPPAGRG